MFKFTRLKRGQTTAPCRDIGAGNAKGFSQTIWPFTWKTQGGIENLPLPGLGAMCIYAKATAAGCLMAGSFVPACALVVALHHEMPDALVRNEIPERVQSVMWPTLVHDGAVVAVGLQPGKDTIR